MIRLQKSSEKSVNQSSPHRASHQVSYENNRRAIDRRGHLQLGAHFKMLAACPTLLRELIVLLLECLCDDPCADKVLGEDSVVSLGDNNRFAALRSDRGRALRNQRELLQGEEEGKSDSGKWKN